METINITDTLSIKDKNSNIQIEDKNSITDEAIFENAIPLVKDEVIEDNIITDEIKKSDEIKTIDFFDEHRQELEKQKEEKEIFDSLIKEEDIFASAVELEEPSTWEKLQYGWAKNDMVVGNIFQIGENIWESAFDDEKTFKEAALENTRIEQEEFEKEYWKFRGGKYDGAYTKIGEAATYLLDPYYLGGYFFGSSLLASPMSSAFLNAALLGGDNLIEQLAKHGEVKSWGDVGVSAGIGAGIGFVLPVGGKLLKKYLPSSVKDRAANIAKFIDDKIARKNKMDPADVALLRSVANKEPVKKITKQIDDLVTSPSFVSKGSNFAAPIIKARSDYFNIRTKIAKQLTDIRATKKLTKKTKWGSEEFKATALKAQGKKILDLKLQGKVAKEKWKIEKLRLQKRQVAQINKYYKLENDRLAVILGEVTGNFNVGEKFLHAVLANFTKPLMGAFAGGAANVGASIMGADVEDDLMAWMAIGAAFGGAFRIVGNSTKIPLAQKDAYGRIIKNTGTRFVLQKVREWTAGTLATKLNSFGGTTQKIGRLLLRQIDDPMAAKSTIANADAMEKYLLKRASLFIENSTPEEQVAAIMIRRGNKEIQKNASPKVLKLAAEIKSFTDEISLLASQAGFKSAQTIDDYFPRVLNWDKIDKNYDAAHKVFTDIFKKTYKLDDKRAAKAATDYLEAGVKQESVINASAWAKIMEGMSVGAHRKYAGASDDLVFTPMSEHIIQKRSLNGPYKLVEEVLEKHGYLVNDLTEILPKMVQDSVKSIAFARTFGKNGELLKPLMQEIKQKYDDLIISDRNKAGDLLKIGDTKFTKIAEAQHEAKLVLDSVDAYFGRYVGMGNPGQLKSLVGILTMLSNLNMLGRVTIASLGDLVQIFQHSSNFSAALKGMARTNVLKARWEKGLAKNLNLDIGNELGKYVQRAAASGEQKFLLNNNKWFGHWGVKDIKNPNLYNNLAFKGLGLEWLTGYARRFAYNAGTFDAYTLARNYHKIVKGAKGINSKQAAKLRKDLYEKYGIKSNDALNIGKYKNLKTAITNKNATLKLNEAGLKASNRDALIPQVDNRLLFTQSKTPWIRMLGQFLSWAQAKSASANRIIKRIEDGDAIMLLKTLGTIPIYAGIQQLREYAKYGTVHSDWAYNKKELLAKSWQLSGNPGWISDLIFNRFLGPGKKGSNYFVFAPAMNMFTNILDYGLTYVSGDKKKRKKILDKKILPIPGWRKRIQQKWFPRKVESGFSISDKQGLNKGGSVRKKYNIGDEVNKKDIAAAAIAATMAVNGANAEIPTFSEGVEQKYPSNELGVIKKEAEKIDAIDAQMAEAAEKKILPKKKPPVTNEIKYRNISELAPEKKAWLLDTAEKVYVTNTGKVIPNDIIIAMASGETGWGTSGFLNKGSNNLFNFQSFNDEEKSIAASGSNAKIKVFDKPEDSITELLTWIQNKESYAPVRQEIALYNDGKGSKERIIKAIAATGFAEDDKWANKITSILNSRIDGKHKEELNKLYSTLFVDN